MARKLALEPFQLSRAPKWAFPFAGVRGEKKNHRPYRTMILFLSLCLGLPALRSYQQGAANLPKNGGLGALEGSFRFLFQRLPWEGKTMRGLALLLFLPSLCFADDWTREDSYRQAVIAVLQVVDWGQTRYIAKHPEFHELNPLIGRHPSIGRVNNYFAISIPANIAISAFVPSKYRALWQTSRLMIQVSVVSYNKGVSIGTYF